MGALTLEIVEGPGAGRQIRLERSLVIGRSADADVVLEDDRVSRRHARVAVGEHDLVIDDLGSANGTFVNQNELHGPARIGPGDELLLGVTLMQVRTEREIAIAPSAVRPVPPGLATAERPPSYVKPAAPPPGPAELTSLLDVRTRHKAQVAPLAAAALATIVVVVYLVLHGA